MLREDIDSGEFKHIITLPSSELQEVLTQRMVLIRVAASGSCINARRRAPLSNSVADEYKMKAVEKVKYIGGEDGGVDGQNSTENSALLSKGQSVDETGSNGKILSIHSSESQQEFFRMLDEKIEKGRDYCSEEEDIT
ncbi:uncharacterized protein C1orf21 homolog isoform X2 [Betta splendens]|uniref:Uncharacterized protein C1orf21 homolog isoform X2 n=1 Tax=Betta splendens TaxID=158456 RepID=A0A6P7L3I8_BETSP|nr:uncharacterized protein C1orf21 homolog isoform X2 [Betta splendens]